MYDNVLGQINNDYVLKDKYGNAVEFTNDKAANIKKIIDFVVAGNCQDVADPIKFAEDLAEKNSEVIKTTLGSLKQYEEKTLYEEENNDILSILTENGLEIVSAKRFDVFLGNTESNEDTKGKLLELTKLRDEAIAQAQENQEKGKTAFVDYARDVNLEIENIEKIVAKDYEYSATNEYFAKKPGTKLFLDSLQELKNSFGIVEEYFRDQKHLEEYQEQLKDVNSRIESLDKDNTLSSSEKNKQAVLLTSGKRDLKAQISKYKKSCEEKNAAIKNIDLEDFKRKIIAKISNLGNIYRNDLALESSVMNELAQAINNINDKYVSFIKASTLNYDKMPKYEQLCEKYGIKDNDIVKKIGNVQEKKQEQKTEENIIRNVPDLFEIVNHANSGHIIAENGKIISDIALENVKLPEGFSLKDGKLTNADGSISVDIEYRDPNKDMGITDANELAKEIVATNKDNKEVTVEHELFIENGAFKDTLIVEGDVNKVVLPDGFEYKEGLGITNGKGLDLPVEIKLKKESIIDKFKNLTQGTKSRLGGKSKFKVTNTRNAIIEPYGKAILLGSGIAFAGAVLAPVYIPLLTATLYGAGFGIAAETLYRLVKRGSYETIPELETASATPEEDVNNKLTGLEKLKGMLIRKRKNKVENSTRSEKPISEEQPEVIPVEQVAPTNTQTHETAFERLNQIQNITDSDEHARALEEFINGDNESREGMSRR